MKFEKSNDQSQLIFGSLSVIQARDAVSLPVSRFFSMFTASSCRRGFLLIICSRAVGGPKKAKINDCKARRLDIIEKKPAHMNSGMK